MANHQVSHLIGGYELSFVSLLISFSVYFLLLTTPILSPSDIPNFHSPLADQTLRNLAFLFATLTNCLALVHLKLHMTKPIVSATTSKRLSSATLCLACVTLILGLFFILKVVVLDPFSAGAMGAVQGGDGGQIKDVVNFFIQNRKFGR